MKWFADIGEAGLAAEEGAEPVVRAEEGGSLLVLQGAGALALSWLSLSVDERLSAHRFRVQKCDRTRTGICHC